MIIIKINNDNSDKNSNNEKIYKIENTPCTLGRSLKNNVIIDDDSISANHALIDSDEKGVFIRDLNSTNGIKKDNVLVDQHYIHEKTTFMLGEIQIEVIFDDEHLEKTRIITIPKEFYVNNNNKQKLNILLCLLISGLLIFLSQYFSAPLRKDDVIKILADFFGTVFIIVFQHWFYE